MVENFDQTILLLTKLQFCHVIDNNTGVVRLVEGPYRGPLESNEAIYGSIKSKLIVNHSDDVRSTSPSPTLIITTPNPRHIICT